MKHYLWIIVLTLMLTGMLTVTVAAQESTPQPCPAGPVPDSAPVIKIGAAVSDTGKYAREGGDTRNGYALWLDWINQEHGGINVGGVCYKADIVFYDDESTADTVSLLTEKLITEDQVNFILGPYSSGLTQVASVITERENIIMVEGNGASDSLFTRGFQNLFAVLTPGTLYTRSGIEMAHQLGAQTAVIAYEDEPFSTSVADGAEQWLTDLGMQVLDKESYPTDVADVSSMFTHFRELNPDIFVGGGHFNDSVLFVNTAKELGFSPKAFLITVGPSNPQFVTEMGADSNFVWGASQWESSLDYKDDYFGTAAEYAQRYQDKYDAPPSYQAAESTAAALVLQLGIESAGALDSDSVRAALHNLDVETFYGPVKFNETGENIGKPMVTIQIQDGHSVVIAPSDAAVAEPIWPAPLWDQRG